MCKVILFLLVLAGQLFAGEIGSISIFSKDSTQGAWDQITIEVSSNKNLMIEGYTLKYFFKVPLGGDVVLGDWVSPGVDASLEKQADGNMALVYHFSNKKITRMKQIVLKAGLESVTEKEWFTGDDWSHFEKGSSRINPNIVLYDKNGKVVYGVEPKKILSSDYVMLEVEK